MYLSDTPSYMYSCMCKYSTYKSLKRKSSSTAASSLQNSNPSPPGQMNQQIQHLCALVLSSLIPRQALSSQLLHLPKVKVEPGDEVTSVSTPKLKGFLAPWGCGQIDILWCVCNVLLEWHSDWPLGLSIDGRAVSSTSSRASTLDIQTTGKGQPCFSFRGTCRV